MIKNAIITLLWITVGLATLLCVLALPGCLVIWHDDVFVGTLFKAVDANDLEFIAEPNYIQVGSGNSRTKNDSIRVITPSIIIESK